MKINHLLVTLYVIIFSSCSITRPIETRVITTYKDSTIYHDSTVYRDIPRERIVDIVPSYDTLKLETSLAKALAFVDTNTHSLRGTIENKDTLLPVIIKWKEHIVYRDSIQIKETPSEPIKVKEPYIPKSYWVLLGLVICGILYIGINFYLKIR